MRNIEEALQEHKQAVLAAGYAEEQILGIFVYGSQNYGTATENSDVDTKAVIIPTMRQLAFYSVKKLSEISRRSPIDTRELPC